MNRREMLGWMGAAGAGWMAAANGALAQDGHDHGHAHGHDEVYNPLAAGYDADKGEYILPPLPYGYDALEPSIDELTMRTHHDKHHAGYVAGLNSALKKLAAARQAGDFNAIRSLSRAVSFNGGGHTLHTLFWANLAPAGHGGGGEPGAALKAMLERDFGSVDAFRAHFSAAAGGVEGSGWGIAGLDTMADRLVVIQGENQQKLTTWSVMPVLVLDVWEHAYYLKYQNRRGDYVKAFWDVVNWAEVARRVGIHA
jgi:Fe-Mn family superoxide dismutase